MSHFHNNVLIGSGGQGEEEFKIERSLRFNKADNAYLNRTPSSQGNRKTWTWSGWVKRSGNNSDHHLFVADKDPSASLGNSTFGRFYIESGGAIRYSGYTAAYRTTTALLRDQSAWYHIVLAVDTTQSTADDRIKIYLNGSQITTFTTKNNPSQDAELAFNQTTPHTIGARSRSGTIAHWLDGYLAEVQFVDGQALAASDFGEYDDNDIWQPKEFAGSYNVTVAAPYSGTVPTSTTDVPPAGSYGNGIATAAVLFGGTLLTNGQNHIRQDGGAIEWSAAIPLTSGDVAGAQCLYFNNTSTHAIEFKIDGNWVTVQSAANAVIGTTQGQGALITYTATGSVSWTGVKAAGGSNISVTTVAGIFVNGNLVGENDTVGVNGFHLKFADNSSNSALGTDSSGNSNTWTVNNLLASLSNPSYDSTHGSNITPAEAAKIFDSDDSTYGVATGDFVGFAYGGSSVTMKVENTSSSQVSFYIQPNVSNNPANSGTWSSQSAGTVSSNQWYIPANTTATAKFAFPATWDGDGRIYTNSAWTSLRFYSMDAYAGDFAGIDSMIDSPSSYAAASGNNGGNYCVYNPLREDRSGYNEAPTNGNLDTNPRGDFTGTIPVTSGKWYWEITITTVTNSGQGYIGVLDVEQIATGGSRGWATSQIAAMRDNGSLYGDGKTGSGVSYAQGDILGFALDASTGKLWIAKNNTWINSGAPASGTGHAFSGLSYSAYTLIASDSQTGNKYSLNAGQRPFIYTPPTNFVSICTKNLPDPPIAKGSTVFDTKLYTGTGSNFTVTYDFSPDFAWIKGRSYTSNGQLSDTVRSSAGNKRFELPTGNAEDAGGPTFVSTGLSLGTNAAINTNNQTYVSWAWDAGSSTVSNSDGSITSNVRANTSAGFSIVSWSGNSQNATVGHGLGAVPKMIIHKRRNGAASFITYHEAIGNTNAMQFNASDALINAGYFDNKSPTSTIFNVSDFDETNRTGSNYIAYCFTPIEGYSAFGSYEGNGSSNGPFVYTGFRPAFVLYKNVDAAAGWQVYDSSRDTFNVCDARLQSNSTAAEDTVAAIDILSNGFKQYSTHTRSNANNNTYLYAAFAEHPLKTARAR